MRDGPARSVRHHVWQFTGVRMFEGVVRTPVVSRGGGIEVPTGRAERHDLTGGGVGAWGANTVRVDVEAMRPRRQPVDVQLDVHCTGTS